jgi:hypothetical protein
VRLLTSFASPPFFSHAPGAQVCRLACDADASWAVKLQALGALNTLVSIGNSEEERLDLRAEVPIGVPEEYAVPVFPLFFFPYILIFKSLALCCSLLKKTRCCIVYACRVQVFLNLCSSPCTSGHLAR